MISYSGYLTEQKLIEILKNFFTTLKPQFSFPKSRRRYDCFINLLGIPTLIEFDGAQHYIDSDVIKADDEKDILAKQNNYKLIRIPYFIQLNHKTSHLYFSSLKIDSCYPNGFIDLKAKLPASYCELGIKRFESEFKTYSEFLQEEIKLSLRKKLDILDKKYVIPSTLECLIK